MTFVHRDAKIQGEKDVEIHDQKVKNKYMEYASIWQARTATKAASKSTP